MNVQQKGDIATAATSALGLSGVIQYFNGWVAEYMPLFTLVGIIIGLLLSWWYYSSSLKMRERQHQQDHEAKFGRRVDDDQDE